MYILRRSHKRKKLRAGVRLAVAVLDAEINKNLRFGVWGLLRGVKGIHDRNFLAFANIDLRPQDSGHRHRGSIVWHVQLVYRTPGSMRSRDLSKNREVNRVYLAGV